MTRRSVIIFLHWSVVMLVLIMIKGGVSSPWALWSFVVLVAIWNVLTLWRGLLGKPGPKLSHAVRRAYPWMHRAMHVLLGLTALALCLRLLGHPQPYLNAWVMLLVTLAAGTFHGLFHFWRHTALYDNALRLITPKFMHKYL